MFISALALFAAAQFVLAEDMSNSLEQNSSLCLSLPQKLKIDHGEIHSATRVKAGTTLKFPTTKCDVKSQVVDADMCRVAMTIVTGPASNVSLEAWLPDKWTGRLMVVGNGGLDGCIHYPEINYGSSLGFATVGTNNGHDGYDGKPFYKNSGVVADFAYRAIHTAASVVRSTSTTYYNRPYTKSYFLGCSGGGRQGFKEAQSFPDDFDGILAGAPAFDFSSLLYWSANAERLFSKPGRPEYLTPYQWKLVDADIFKQCDLLDGVRDSVIEDPTLCQYRPESLICAPGQTKDCLTATQASAVRSIFEPLYGPDGQLVYPRLQPGGDSADTGNFTGTHDYTRQWFRYAIYNDPNWNQDTMNLTDWVTAKKRNPFNVDSWEGDLSKFQKRGGKLLHYHGLQDAVISSSNSIRYYDLVSRTMNLPSEKLDEFYRFFRISGMSHCWAGNGATFIGNYNDTLAGYSANNNIVLALVRWVEEGIAPDVVRGTKFANDSWSEGKIVMQRDHCRYPLRNTWNRRGDPSLRQSWNCL